MNSTLLQLSKLAIKAGVKIMKIYAEDFEVYNKQDASPVTMADRLVEKIIIAGLKDISPNIPIIAEEMASDNKLPSLKNSGNLFYLVDPLDGTKEFINKRNEFTVNIALIENNKPIIGVIFAPASNMLYVGDTKQKIAYHYKLNDDFNLDNPVFKQNIAHIKSSKKPYRVLASRSHINVETLRYIEALKVKHNHIEIMNIGSSLKLCLLAQGAADIYPRFGPTMEWDIAAGHAILTAANGYLHNADGTEFIYGKEDKGYLNPNFIAYAQL